MPTDEERHARGLAAFAAVYGDIVPAPPSGGSEAFELLVIDQQFAEVWTRPGLPIAARRLLVIGVLASVGNWTSLELVLLSAMEAGELDADAVREAAIHLISYLGTTKAGEILRVSENAIERHPSDPASTP